MTPAGQQQTDGRIDFDDANRERYCASPTCPRVGTVLAAVNDAARRLRRWPMGHHWPRLRAAPSRASGRGGETAPSRTKKRIEA